MVESHVTVEITKAITVLFQDAENAIKTMHGKCMVVYGAGRYGDELDINFPGKMLGGRAIRTNWASRKGPQSEPVSFHLYTQLVFRTTILTVVGDAIGALLIVIHLHRIELT